MRLEDLQFEGQAMKQIEYFTCLGSVFASDGKVIQESQRRRAGATQAFRTLRRRMWGSREVSVMVKMKVFNVIVLPVLAYDATAFTLTITEEKKMDAFEMKMLRNIAGVRCEDMVRNVDIRDRLRQPPVSLLFRRARVKWFGYVKRTGEERQVKRIMRAGKRKRGQRGRSMTRLKDVIKHDIETSALGLKEAAAEGRDCDGWRQIMLTSGNYTQCRGGLSQSKSRGFRRAKYPYSVNSV